MTLKYLTDSFLGRLRSAVPQNSARYMSSQMWIDEFSAGAKCWRETGINTGPLPQLPLSGKPADDADSAILLYTALRDLSPIQAMEERLWAYLSHTIYWQYMVARWGTPKTEVIIDRFFLKRGGIGSLVRNGIARLWWSAFLTHDEKRTDPFELTRILLSKQDIHTGLMERNLGKSPSIRRAALDYFKANGQKLESYGNWSKLVQKIMLDLNTAGGVYLLDALKAEQVHEIINTSVEALAA